MSQLETKDVESKTEAITSKNIEPKEEKPGFPEISIKAETVYHVGSFKVTNSLVLSAVVFIFFIFIALRYSREIGTTRKTGFFYIFNTLLRGLYGLFESIMGHNITFFFPLLSAFFIYVLLQNWFGLLPGVGSILIGHVPLFRGNNADLNATLALAIISVVLMQVYGIKFLGFKEHILKYVNLTNPINFFLGFLEILSEISRVLSFAFRLFGNIFAGEVLMTIVAFLVPVLASFPFLILEIFVGLVQALVFSLLTSVFMSLAVAKHH